MQQLAIAVQVQADIAARVAETHLRLCRPGGERLAHLGGIVCQKGLIKRLLAQAKEQGVGLVGPGGLLNQFTRSALETALKKFSRGESA